MYEARQGQTKKKEKQIGADDEGKCLCVVFFFLIWFLIFNPVVWTKLFVFQGCGPAGCVCVIYGLIDLGFDYKQMIDRVGAYPAPTLVHIQPGWATISATDPTHTDYHSLGHPLHIHLSPANAAVPWWGCHLSLSLSLSQIATLASKVDPPLSLSLHTAAIAEAAGCFSTEFYHSSSLGA